MPLEHLDHVTLRVRPADLPTLLCFYTAVLELEAGPRPAFSFPGHWLYRHGRPVVHLAGNPPDAPGLSEGPHATGPLDHVAFRSTNVQETRRHLEAHGIPFREAPVPGFPLHQLFLQDPTGLRIELTFDAPTAD